jgi:hypothetical protein
MAATPNSSAPTRARTPRASTAKRRSTASKRTAASRASSRAAAQREAAKTPVDRGLDYAQSAVLIPVGVALETRDRVVETVNGLITTYSDRQKAKTQLRRFERRGTRARNNLEREVRRTRTQVERQLRQRRRRVERALNRFDRQRTTTAKNVSTQLENVSAQVENAVQSGITAGGELATRVQERVLNSA